MHWRSRNKSFFLYHLSATCCCLMSKIILYECLIIILPAIAKSEFVNAVIYRLSRGCIIPTYILVHNTIIRRTIGTCDKGERSFVGTKILMCISRIFNKMLPFDGAKIIRSTHISIPAILRHSG